ncbi:zinc-binding alcohol dehydrogenase family protein [Massilia sp. W12]|uniref:zinc-binding alcohol dehydrogenase family protein n=1 Tax=Massilia sp. W12 TaxID=3126507 RepID=UPI0030D00E87
MKAIAIREHLPLDHANALLDIEMPKPQATGRDLLVKIEAIAVNPVDAKVRASDAFPGPTPDADGRMLRVLGWDAAGVVEAVGPQVTQFKPGDRVYYAGALQRQGAYSEYQLVDERITGHMPASLDFSQAAALPLTTITAWEALFERLRIAQDGAARGKRILIIAGAGGVGSIAIQLARQVAGLEVIATASREDSAAWCRSLGANHVIDHSGNMPAQLQALGLPQVDYVLCASELEPHFDALAEIIAPQGLICAIVETAQALPMVKLMAKSAGLVWEMMFTRSLFSTSDMQQQHVLLERAAQLIDQGVLRSTMGENYGRINAANLRRAHAAIEGKHTRGKIVLSGF